MTEKLKDKKQRVHDQIAEDVRSGQLYVGCPVHNETVFSAKKYATILQSRVVKESGEPYGAIGWSTIRSGLQEADVRISSARYDFPKITIRKKSDGTEVPLTALQKKKARTPFGPGHFMLHPSDAVTEANLYDTIKRLGVASDTKRVNTVSGNLEDLDEDLVSRFAKDPDFPGGQDVAREFVRNHRRRVLAAQGVKELASGNDEEHSHAQ